MVFVLAACSSDAATVNTGSTGSSSSAAASTTSMVMGATTVPAGEATTSTPDTGTAPTLLLPADASCSLGAPPPGGQTTFVSAGKLWGVDDAGAVACLADLGGRAVSWLSWSPDGDEVLIGPNTVLRADGTFTDSGYFADNTAVRWSAPTGKALLAPKATTGELIWRNAHDSGERIDVTFTDATTSAAYHPAGKHIAAAGVGRDGNGPGVFLASNRGESPQRLGQLEEGTSASEVAFEMSGDSVAFVHHHADGTAHVHRYNLVSGFLETVADVDVAPTDLIASPVDQGDLAWTESQSTINSMAYVFVAGAAGPVVARDPVGDHLSRPIGWLPGHRLLVASTSAGPTDGTFDLWVWSPDGMTNLIDGVSAAAARTVHGAYNELPQQLGSGFG